MPCILILWITFSKNLEMRSPSMFGMQCIWWRFNRIGEKMKELAEAEEPR